MKIAVAYDIENGEIFEHFGHAEHFAIYEYADMDINNCRKTVVDCTGLHGHADMAQLMKNNGVDAIIAGNMGAEARAMLLTMGIVPIIGYCGDADTAADLLIEGRLPIVEGGGCSGGCGGCSGCSHDDGGECGCGGDCGCGC